MPAPVCSRQVDFPLVHSHPALPLAQPLLPIGYEKHETFPFAVKTGDQSSAMQLKLTGGTAASTHATVEIRPDSRQADGDNPELVVARKPVHSLAYEQPLAVAKALDASLLRHQSHMHEMFIAVQRAELQYERTSLAHYVSGASSLTHDVWVKHTDTGHLLAPGYVPLTTLEMTELVEAMQQVYRSAAAEKVATLKNDHRFVLE